MIRHLNSGAVWLALGALFAVPALPAEAQEQEVGGRMRVFVPDLRATDGSNHRFGERAAEELRSRIDDLLTHAPVDDGEVRDALRQYRLNMRELSCAESRQLATVLNAELVMCGEYEEDGNEYVVDASFISTSTGESFDIEDLRVPTGNEREGGAAIFDEFGEFVEQTSTAFYCQQDFQSQNWESAYERCNRAVELAPDLVSTRFIRGRVLREQGDMEGALEDFEHVLEIEPQHESALQNAGYAAAQVGRHDDARRYYTEYLRLNPTNTQVRMREAYELAQAGDAYGALGLVEEGLEHDPDNVELHRQIGNFAFSAAGRERDRMQGDNGGELPSEVRELYERAVEAYEFVFQDEDEETETRPSEYRNTASALIQLGDLERAASIAQQGIEEHGDEPALWSVYADALQRQGNIDEAIDALEEVKSIDPEYGNLAARQGRWLLDVGRQEEAMQMFHEAVERGEQSPDAIANMLFGEGYQNGHQEGDFDHAIRYFEAAKQFDVSPELGAQLNFWHGFSLYNQAMAIQEAGTVESARQTLPMFEQSRELLQSGRDYAPTVNVDFEQLMTGVNTYIEIQEAIIARDGRRR